MWPCCDCFSYYGDSRAYDDYSFFDYECVYSDAKQYTIKKMDRNLKHKNQSIIIKNISKKHYSWKQGCKKKDKQCLRRDCDVDWKAVTTNPVYIEKKCDIETNTERNSYHKRKLFKKIKNQHIIYDIDEMNIIDNMCDVSETDIIETNQEIDDLDVQYKNIA